LYLRDCYLSCILVGYVLRIVDLNCIELEYSLLIYLSSSLPPFSSLLALALALFSGSLGQHMRVYPRTLGCPLVSSPTPPKHPLPISSIHNNTINDAFTPPHDTERKTILRKSHPPPAKLKTKLSVSSTVMHADTSSKAGGAHATCSSVTFYISRQPRRE
jgi:hypothetical protein